MVLGWYDGLMVRTHALSGFKSWLGTLCCVLEQDLYSASRIKIFRKKKLFTIDLLHHLESWDIVWEKLVPQACIAQTQCEIR